MGTKRAVAGAGLSVGALLALGVAAEASALEVDQLADNTSSPSPCDPATELDCTLRGALLTANIASGAQTITFKSGLSGTISLLKGQIPIHGTATIIGPGADRVTVDANHSSRIFDVTTAGRALGISGLSLVNGKVGDLELGGAIQINAGSGPVTISQSSLRSNEAGSSGGAIHADSNELVISNSTLSGNVSGGNGGAIDTFDPSSIATCTSKTTIVNSTISGNSAAFEGGGFSATCLYNSPPRNEIQNSTVAGNSAGVSEGGVGGTGSQYYHSTFLRNSIVADNTAPIAPDVEYYSTRTTFSLIEHPPAGFGATEDNLLNIDPQLGPLAANGGPTMTQKPAAGSPVIDQGRNIGVFGGPITDQRGSLRPFDVPALAQPPAGDGADMGAVELTLAEATPPVITPPPPTAKKKCKKHRKLKKGKCVKKKHKK
jgi:hypothetical protein